MKADSYCSDAKTSPPAHLKVVVVGAMQCWQVDPALDRKALAAATRAPSCTFMKEHHTRDRQPCSYTPEIANVTAIWLEWDILDVKNVQKLVIHGRVGPIAFVSSE